MTDVRCAWTYLRGSEADKKPAVVCKRCGKEETVEFPISVPDLVKLKNKFNAKHVKCKEPRR